MYALRKLRHPARSSSERIFNFAQVQVNDELERNRRSVFCIYKVFLLRRLFSFLSVLVALWSRIMRTCGAKKEKKKKNLETFMCERSPCVCVRACARAYVNVSVHEYVCIWRCICFCILVCISISKRTCFCICVCSVRLRTVWRG